MRESTADLGRVEPVEPHAVGSVVSDGARVAPLLVIVLRAPSTPPSALGGQSRFEIDAPMHSLLQVPM
jgi:hypothetical protein